MFLTFFKLCKWYQIAQRITYEGDKRKSGKGKGSPVISSLFLLSFNAVTWIYFVPVICSYNLTYRTLFLVNEKLSTRSTINRNICPKVLRRMCSKSASLLKKSVTCVFCQFDKVLLFCGASVNGFCWIKLCKTPKISIILHMMKMFLQLLHILQNFL